MKKLLLTVTMGLAITSSYAQQQQKTILSPQAKGNGTTIGGRLVQPMKGTATSTVNKPTDKTAGEWFCFMDAQTSLASQAAVWTVYPDSNIKTYIGNFNWYLHGMGTSFDPTSKKFQPSDFANPTPVYPMPTFKVAATNAYTIDSINIRGWYDRYRNNGVDTLFVEVVATGTTGTFDVTWSYLDVIAGRPDSNVQVGEAIYNWRQNAITPDSVPQVQRIVKYLDQAAFEDSTSDGFHSWNFALPTPITVAAGRNVVAFAHFGSFNKYALNTDMDTVNSWQHYTSALYGANNDPNQIVDDYNGGLLATTSERYQVDNPYKLSNGSAVFAVGYAYTPHYMNDPWFAFHVKCPTCSDYTVSVNDVKGATLGEAYPNPANNTITIPFTTADAANVKVIVTNAVGATIASQDLGKIGANQNGKAIFNVANYASGVYFYTVEANGQRTTKRFAVTH